MMRSAGVRGQSDPLPTNSCCLVYKPAVLPPHRSTHTLSLFLRRPNGLRSRSPEDNLMEPHGDDPMSLASFLDVEIEAVIPTVPAQYDPTTALPGLRQQPPSTAVEGSILLNDGFERAMEYTRFVVDSVAQLCETEFPGPSYCNNWLLQTSNFELIASSSFRSSSMQQDARTAPQSYDFGTAYETHQSQTLDHYYINGPPFLQHGTFQLHAFRPWALQVFSGEVVSKSSKPRRHASLLKRFMTQYLPQMLDISSEAEAASRCHGPMTYSDRPGAVSDVSADLPSQCAVHSDAMRQLHVLAERKRRHKQNQSFKLLKTLIPAATLPKKDKATILDCTIKYIKELEGQIETLKQRQRDQELDQGSQAELISDGSAEEKLPSEAPGLGSSCSHSKLQCATLDMSIVNAESSHNTPTIRLDITVLVPEPYQVNTTMIRIYNGLKSLNLLPFASSSAYDFEKRKLLATISLTVEPKDDAHATFENLLQYLEGIRIELLQHIMGT